MKKGFQRVLVLFLALSMVFTMTGLPAFAAEGDLLPVDEPAEEEMLAQPAEEEVPAQPAEEAVPAQPADEEMPAQPAEGEQETQVLTDGTYTVAGLSTAVLSMYHFDSETARVVVKGDDAWLITSIDGTQEPSTLNRFDGMAYGPQSAILDETDESHHTLVDGTPVANVIDIYGDDDETVVGRTFVLPVPKSVLEAAGDIYYMIKYRAGYSATHDGDWYKAGGGDYYLTGYKLEKESDSTDLPGEETPVEPETIELAITNNTGMFKAVTATAVKKADGSADLTFALSGTGYHWLYKGTYEEALAANENIAAGIAAGESSGNLIKGTENEDGLLEFEMEISADELGKTVPVVAISESYYQKFVSGQNALERAYYPRQFNLDLDSETLVTGDYDMDYEFTLVTDVEDFKAATPVSVHIVGGPNSNNYKVEPTLVMNDETYDKVTFPSTTTPKEASLTDGKFAISMVNKPNNAAFKDKTPLTFTFHVAENAPYEEAGTDVERTVTFDQIAKTITVEGTPLTPKETPGPSYEAGQYVISAKVTKSSPEGSAFTMFIPNLSGAATNNDPDNNKVNLIIDNEGVLKLQFTNYKTSYPAIYMGTLAEGQNPESFDATKLKVGVKEGSVYSYTFTIDASMLGTSFPIALAKKAEPGSANSDWYTTQLYMTLGDELMDITVYNVIKQIDALPDAADVTVRSKDDIEAARAAYEALTDDQKAEVTNLSKLTAAEEAFAALAGKDEATEAVETAIESLIQNYIDVNETTAAAVAAARDAYDALSVQQKAYISDETYQKLMRAEACVKFADPAVRNSGIIVDAGINTDSGSIVGTVLGGPGSDTYLYIYTDANTKIKKVSGTVSQSTQKVIGDGKLMETIWILGTTEPHGREFVIQLTDLNGNAKGEEITVKIPGAYGTLAEGTYEVAAIQTPSSQMRQFKRSTITSDGTAMTVEFVMPNTTYGKVFLGTKEEAEAATEGFIEPTGTEATSGTTGEGNVYTIPLESMYMPITISYCNTSKNTWTQETVEFVVDEQTQTVIDAIAALNLNTYFNVKIDQRDQVTLADGLHQALNDNQKAIVENTNYSTLKKTVAMFAAADKVAAQIEALPAADAVTENDAALIREVKNAFDNMGSDPDLVEALNGNSLQNSQVEKLVSQELRDKLNACAALPAYYTAVDAAIAAVPADLSAYTDETAQAVTDAVAAVDRTKTIMEQEEVDAMAKAINDAVEALKVKSGWIKEDGEWYYYNTDGTMLTEGWAKDGKGWCWMDENGKITKSKWIKDKGEWYYLKANGYMAAKEWTKDSKGWMYMNASGKITKSQWVKDNGEWYYLKANGYMAANEWAKDSGGWMYMNASGKITKSQWVKDNGEWYYLKTNGYMAANEWAKDSGGWMYMNASGKITKSQWVKDGGAWYYLKANGYMATGKQTIGGKVYQFASSGKLIQ